MDRRTLLGSILGLLAAAPPTGGSAGVFLRVRVAEPRNGRFRVTTGGNRHAGEPWFLPAVSVEVENDAWSDWLDLSAWPWHGRVDRSGGIAEWPSLRLGVARVGPGGPVRGCVFAVQLADAPNAAGVVHSFEEKSASDTIGFLVPFPLRGEHAREFETGTQMAARHRRWAEAAVRSTGRPFDPPKRFDIITYVWGHYDPALARQAVDTLRTLGFNVVGGVDFPVLRAAGVPRTYAQTWTFGPDPEATSREWAAFARTTLARDRATEEGRARLRATAHYVLADEVQTLDFRGVDPARRDGWFRAYLRQQGVTEADLGKSLDAITYPADALFAPTLPRNADLPTRRLLYHAAKFGQWWSAKQLRHSSDLVHAALPGMKTETLPSDHGFFNAWGAPHIGMSYRLLDLFAVGAQHAVDQLSAEDWLGLNHMYGPGYTWTGAQTFGYFNALLRSAIGERPILLRSLITPSDDKYLRLKAYSGLAQGAKSFFFWTFGPTHIGTENYWSDLRSEYDGIAKLSRALAKAEDVLYSARPVRDPVAVLYSVSHDIWNTDDPAAFVEKRLLWHALRHLHVQPDFVREEDVAAPGFLAKYKVLYVVDWCVSRRAGAAIDEWVRAGGGVVYLSAGAATRDEFFEPHLAPFARAVWPDDAAARLISEPGHAYNERADLPAIKPLARARVRLTDGGKPFDLPALGCRLDLRPDAAGRPFAVFDDEKPAGAMVRHGRGRVIALGFLPMLAYGQGAHFKPTTLEENWPAAPRKLASLPLRAAGVTPVAKASVPVVETSLLCGPNGSAVVLVNYTYKPVNALTVDLRLPPGTPPPTRAVSTEGGPVRLQKTGNGRVRLELPLAWTDIVLLPNP